MAVELMLSMSPPEACAVANEDTEAESGLRCAEASTGGDFWPLCELMWANADGDERMSALLAHVSGRDWSRVCVLGKRLERELRTWLCLRARIARARVRCWPDIVVARMNYDRRDRLHRMRFDELASGVLPVVAQDDVVRLVLLDHAIESVRQNQTERVRVLFQKRLDWLEVFNAQPTVDLVDAP